MIELLVSMGIIAVLTSMAVFNFNLSRIRARDVQRKSDVDQIQKAMEVYKNDTGSYPTGAFSDLMSALLGGKYVKKGFDDPKGAGDWLTYYYVPEAGAAPKNYYLLTCLENPADPSKTTIAANCAKFTGVGFVNCKCGHSAGQETGVMYILTQP